LSGKLGVGLTTGNFVQSHTPFRELAGRRGGGGGGDEGDEGLRYKTILVTGSDPERARGIAEGYGFRSVVTPADILAAAPDIWPFDPLMAPVYASTARPLPKPLASGADALDGGAEVLASRLKIDAIFVFNDPRDWALDTQLITDLLRSHAGYLGTYSRTSSAAAAAADDDDDGQPELFFSNPDLFWSTGYHLPRFGQGAFQAALRGVWARVTGGAELRCTVIGKPHRETYRFAERKLARHRADMLASRPGREEQQQEEEEVKKVAGSSLRTVYMVGDNPESDIAGANGYESELGAEWCSVLVRTGVWDDKRTGGLASLTGLLKPKMVADTVGDAVGAALKRERWKGTAFPGA
jgi:HAD superfamily hydrolase (TIGR01456 family)